MERHSETLGNALQLFYGHILASTTDGVQIGTLHPQYVSQLLFTHVFSSSLSAAVAAIHTFLVSLLFVFFKVRHKKKPHRPFQGSEADRLFCCFAGRGTGTEVNPKVWTD